jgi:hypothetical protein
MLKTRGGLTSKGTLENGSVAGNGALFGSYDYFYKVRSTNKRYLETHEKDTWIT